MIHHAHELRRYARKIGHPAGDVPAVMLAAADEIERLRTENAGLVDDMNLLRSNNTALRAKIAAMEKQEPLWFIDERGEPKKYHKSKADYCKYGGLDLLYALPGAKGEEK